MIPRFPRIALACILAWPASALLAAYVMPELPPIPAVPAPQPVNSVPLGNINAFPEVKLDFPIAAGPVEPTWSSIATHLPIDPTLLRAAKFGIWVHFGPQSAGESGDWYARNLYKPGSTAYNNHLARYGHPSEVGYKEVLRTWNPVQLDPAALVALYKQAGARFLLLQGVHHDQFDMWNSRYQPWNSTRMGPHRDFLGEWTSAARAAGIGFGLAFHHEYSWWWWQTAFNADTSGAKAGIPYDGHLTLADGAGKWWEGLDPRLLYGIDLREYQGVSSAAASAWSPPPAGLFSGHTDYARWYNTWWALRMIDAIEQYDPDFIYTDGTSTQPFSGGGTGTGYKSDAMQRVIAHMSNRALERRGSVNTHAVVKFHAGDRIATTFENNYPAGIKNDQPWVGDVPVGDWFYAPGFNYSPKIMIHYLLECVSRDGAAAICISPKPDGSLDAACVTMLQSVGQWMDINSAGIYGSRAWLKYGEGTNTQPTGKLGSTQANKVFTPSDFRFTVGADKCLYAYCMTVPAPGAQLRIASLGSAAGLLAAPVEQVTLLGSTAQLDWSQEADALVITCPASMPFQTAVCFKIGPATAVGLMPPSGADANSKADRVDLSWNYGSATATFSVARGTERAGPFTPIATGLTARAFSDTSASPGTVYYYTVAAHEADLSSPPSAPVVGAVAGTGASPWSSADIGAVGAAGSSRQSGGVLVVDGSGADIWGAADEFRFTYGTLSGDGLVTLRVLDMDNTHEWAKAGIMVRQSLAANSAFVIHYLSGSRGVAFQRRGSAGANADGVAERSGIKSPCWLRLYRSGNTFTAYYSIDGLDWQLLGSTSVAMSGPVYAGIAVTSHNDGVICQAIVEGFSIGAIPPPAAPARLSAFGGDARAILNWPAALGASSYTLQRAADPAGPFATLASGLTTTQYTNTGLANGTAYSYRVAATNSVGTGDWSEVVNTTPGPLALPSGWQQADIGSVGVAGSGGQNNGVFGLQGSGADIWGTSDSFRFAAVPLAGDCAVTARVLAMDNTAAWAKAGVMIRQSFAANSAGAINFVSPANGLSFQGRASSGASQGSYANFAGRAAPCWIRLVRAGNLITAFTSSDGVAWTSYGSTTSSMSGTVYAGLAVCSVNNTTLCNALFDHVEVVAAPATPSGLAAVGGSSAISLSWNPVPGAASYRVRRSTSISGPFATLTTATTATTFSDTTAQAGATYYYTVAATNTAGTSAASAAVSASRLAARASWRQFHFGTALAEGDAADLADPDADGVVNLLEYALDADPLAADDSALPRISRENDHLVLRFRRIADPELRYAVEATADLAASPWPETIWNSTGEANLAGPVAVTDPVALSTAPRRFLRLRVE